jgi:hypothetical protein
MSEAEVKIEARTERVHEDKAILEPGEFRAILELIVKDRDGKVTERRIQKSRSFVRQFLELLWTQAFPMPEKLAYLAKDWGGNYHWICQSGRTFRCNAEIGETYYGIVIGSDSTSPDVDDHYVKAVIPHATMNYGAVTFGLPTNDETTSHFTVTRDFSNVSGGTVTVNELALVNEAYRYDYRWHFCTIRDVISGGINVPNGQTLTVNYRLQATI